MGERKIEAEAVEVIDVGRRRGRIEKELGRLAGALKTMCRAKTEGIAYRVWAGAFVAAATVRAAAATQNVGLEANIVNVNVGRREEIAERETVGRRKERFELGGAA